MSDILIIGGTGYIGTSLVQKLQLNNDVTFTGRKKRTSKKFRFLDFQNLESIRNVLNEKTYDSVIILSSLISIDEVRQLDFNSDLFRNNCFLFNQFMIELIKYQSKARIFYVSSMTVYDINSNVPVSEQSRLCPIHNYGFSKLLAENIFNFYSLQNKIDSCIIRIPGVFGGQKDSGLVFNTISKCINNIDIDIKIEKQTFWEGIYLYDLTDLFEKIIQLEGIIGSVVNIGYGEQIDIYSLILVVKKQMNSCVDVNVISNNCKTFCMDNALLTSSIDFNGMSLANGVKKYINEICNR